MRRFYDLVIDGVHFECKNWVGWSSFPPSKLDIRRYRAYKTAQEQWLRDITQHGMGAFTNLRWKVPKAFHDAFSQKVAADFAKLLDSPKFRRYIGADPQYQVIMESFGAVFVNGKMTQGAQVNKILQIFTSHP